MKRYLFLFASFVLLISTTHAQILKRMGDNLKRKIESKANQKVDKTVDDVVDGKLKPKDDKKSSGSSSDTNSNNDNSEGSTGSANLNTGLQAYTKFDFVSGDKVVAYEDFSQDAVGDFPDKWNTNAGGEIVTIAGKQGKWFNPGKSGVFLPEFITALPENFTFEFDLAASPDFSFYSTWFNFIFAEMKTPSKEFTNWRVFHNEGRNGVLISLHPKDAGGSLGMSAYHIYDNGSETMKNQTNLGQFHANDRLFSHVSIWRQKRRLRVYVNENKVWDLPTAFDLSKQYNSVLFNVDAFNNDRDKYYVSNLRLAVGAPDTRNKLITEGKFVTSGILFDFQSATIKPESYGILKEIGTALQDNPDVKINITGHTSNDGDATANIELSKKRAESVKIFLQRNFSIDVSRMTTDGKGGSLPVDKGTTAEAKANNRRVEFVKL